MKEYGDIIYKQKWPASSDDRFELGSCYVAIIFLSIIMIAALLETDWENHDHILNGLIIISGSLLAILIVILMIKKWYGLHYTIFKNGFIYPRRFFEATGNDNYIAYEQIKDMSFYNYGLACYLKLEGKGMNLIEIRESAGVEPYLIIIRELIKRLNKTNIPDFQLLEKSLSSKNKKIKRNALDEFKKKNESFLNTNENQELII